MNFQNFEDLSTVLLLLMIVGFLAALLTLLVLELNRNKNRGRGSYGRSSGDGGSDCRRNGAAANCGGGDCGRGGS